MMNQALFLVGDIGGTHSRLALYQAGQCIRQQHYPTSAQSSIFGHISDFLNQSPNQKVDLLCLAVAGPVENGTVSFTNIGWHFTQAALKQAFGCESYLINDFYAQAMAVSIMPQDQLYHLAGPQTLLQDQPWAVLGVGTGLGEALLIPSAMSLLDLPSHWITVPTEGGHCRFAPKNKLEFELLCFLQARYGEHISTERVLSGQGIVDCYEFLSQGVIKEASEITRLAIDQKDKIACQTMDLFVSCYGDEAANLCLKSKSKAIFLSGGISPKILPLLEPRFYQAFLNKGRYQSLLTQSSLYLVTEAEPGLLGAYAYAQTIYAKKQGKC